MGHGLSVATAKPIISHDPIPTSICSSLSPQLSVARKAPHKAHRGPYSPKSYLGYFLNNYQACPLLSISPATTCIQVIISACLDCYSSHSFPQQPILNGQRERFTKCICAYRLAWGRRSCFQDGSLTGLLAGGLSSLLCGFLGCPHNMAAGFPWRK